ncbi:EAL domain-containing protein [Litorisediminicola beolgyonensis]|uniref:EAL domain-containing protein n=1 Tax=Litorisediminicola beolgyonensis TaxID=1173614 RepID=A0ABW3ZFW3_9RHOB
MAQGKRHGLQQDRAGNALSEAVALRDGDLQAMVARAVRGGDCCLAYQPIVQARRPNPVAFHEALIRVLDETGRIIPAGSFMAEVEDSEIGRVLDCRALDMGFDALRAEPGLRLAVNVSARSIGYPDWLDLLDRHLRHDPGLGERLILEVTESSIMRVPELVATFMRRMQSRGVSFAIDNFAAGATNLRLLSTFQFDIMKIDGAMIRGAAADADRQVLLRAILAIAAEFDMFTVAETVERPDDALFLEELGLDCLQGYFFGAPTITPPWHGAATSGPQNQPRRSVYFFEQSLAT